MATPATSKAPSQTAVRATSTTAAQITQDNSALVVRKDVPIQECAAPVDEDAVTPKDVLQLLVCLAYRSPCGDTDNPSKVCDPAFSRCLSL